MIETKVDTLDLIKRYKQGEKELQKPSTKTKKYELLSLTEMQWMKDIAASSMSVMRMIS